MTKEERTELIKHLKYNRSIGADYIITDKDVDEIIKALEQEPILDKIRAEIERLHYHPKLDFIKNDEIVDMVLDIIDKYNAESEEQE